MPKRIYLNILEPNSHLTEVGGWLVPTDIHQSNSAEEVSIGYIITSAFRRGARQVVAFVREDPPSDS